MIALLLNDILWAEKGLCRFDRGLCSPRGEGGYCNASTHRKPKLMSLESAKLLILLIILWIFVLQLQFKMKRLTMLLLVVVAIAMFAVPSEGIIWVNSCPLTDGLGNISQHRWIQLCRMMLNEVAKRTQRCFSHLRKLRTKERLKRHRSKGRPNHRAPKQNVRQFAVFKTWEFDDVWEYRNVPFNVKYCEECWH